MHTFKFHLTQEVLWHVYNAMHDASRQDRFEHESPIPSKVYALEVRIDLPEGVGAQNVRMALIEKPYDPMQQTYDLVVPDVEIDKREGTPEERQAYQEMLLRLPKEMQPVEIIVNGNREDK